MPKRKLGACGICSCRKYRYNKRTFPAECVCGHLVYSHETEREES